MFFVHDLMNSDIVLVSKLTVRTTLLQTDRHCNFTLRQIDMSIRHTSSSVLAFSAASSIVLSATTASRFVEYFSSCEGKVRRGGGGGNGGLDTTSLHPSFLPLLYAVKYILHTIHGSGELLVLL